MKSPKQKGSRFEKKIAKLFGKIPGWMAFPHQGSGRHPDFPHDSTAIDPLGRRWILEMKKRKHGWRTGDEWKGKAAILVIERDYGEPCIYMSLADFAELVAPLAEVEK